MRESGKGRYFEILKTCICNFTVCAAKPQLPERVSAGWVGCVVPRRPRCGAQ